MISLFSFCHRFSFAEQLLNLITSAWVSMNLMPSIANTKWRYTETHLRNVTSWALRIFWWTHRWRWMDFDLESSHHCLCFALKNSFAVALQKRPDLLFVSNSVFLLCSFIWLLFKENNHVLKHFLLSRTFHSRIHHFITFEVCSCVINIYIFFCIKSKIYVFLYFAGFKLSFLRAFATVFF